ncbi:MAG TPA: hypothetical protein VF824_14240 [Thermoanaerobaculia bacterium]
MKRIYAMLLLLATSIGCGSSHQAASSTAADRPYVDVSQAGALFFGAGRSTPFTINVEITNHAAEPITIKRVRVEPGVMTQYSVYPYERVFTETLASGESRALPMSMTAFTNNPRMEQSEPLSLRVVLDYERGGRQYHERYLNLRIVP